MKLVQPATRGLPCPSALFTCSVLTLLWPAEDTVGVEEGVTELRPARRSPTLDSSRFNMPDLPLSSSWSLKSMSSDVGLSLSLCLAEMDSKSSSGDVALAFDRVAVLRPCSKEDRMRCLNVVCEDSGASWYDDG